MRTIALCRQYHLACPHCLPPVAGSWGITARGMCRRGPGGDCASLTAPDDEQAVNLGDYLVVAGYRSRELYRLKQRELYDVLPHCTADDWPILIKFASDYTARKIPWMVVQNGRCWALIKRVRG